MHPPQVNLIAAALASALAMTFAAAWDARILSGAAGGVIPFLAVLFLLVRPRTNFYMRVWLTAWVYAWGGIAFLSIYTLSGLHWQHGWQYGAAGLIAAAGFAIYAGRARSAAALPPTAVPLTLLHAALLTAGLTFLIASGKLWRDKPDWAANQIFLAGGTALIFVSLTTAPMLIRARRHDRARP